jgi:hypothetical protein
MHLREEEMERYAMRRLPESALRDFELHLLVCHRRQDALAEMDAVVAAMRAACQVTLEQVSTQSRNVLFTLEQVAGERPVE